jgi:mono/diheme cytochrome c family protein
MSAHRTVGSRVGLWSTSILAVAALTAAAGACGADTNDDAAGGRGGAIDGANCASCHGPALEGTDRGPSLLDPMYASGQLSDDAFRSAVRNGVEETRWGFGPMLAMGGLGDGQIDEILAFVRVSQGAGASVTTP